MLLRVFVIPEESLHELVKSSLDSYGKTKWLLSFNVITKNGHSIIFLTLKNYEVSFETPEELYLCRNIIQNQTAFRRNAIPTVESGYL